MLNKTYDEAFNAISVDLIESEKSCKVAGIADC
jgi:hypothetical protein